MTKKTDAPHPIDVKVGKQIRTLRLMRGLSQAEVAEKLGISFQQLQKYETGFNRISASRLFELAEVLDYSMSRFFETVDTRAEAEISEMDIETARVAALLTRIPSNEAKEQLFGLIRALSRSTKDDEN